MTPRARALVTAAAAVVVLAAPPASAQDASRKAAAGQLFDEALKLMDQGKYAEACPKLARSQDLAPSGGTLLNLGECYEKNGQHASAYAAFREAATRAAQAGMKAAENAAIERANRLEPKLLKIKVTLAPGADVPMLEIRRDGLTLKRAELDLELPIDPGKHTLEASATDRKHWQKEIVATPGSSLIEVQIPILEPSGAPTPGKTDTVAPTPTPGGESSSSTWSTQKTIGVAVAGGGLVLAGVGGVFGLTAMSTNDDALTHCRSVDGTQRCDPTGLSLTDDAKSQALLSTIFVGVGVAAIAGGAFLFFTAPSGEKKSAARPHLTATPVAGPNVGGFSLSGSF